MEINLRTSSQQWITHVLHPGPFITHVAVTWKENSYLKYYENGTLVAEVPGSVSERPGYPYTSLSAFVDLPRLWLHRMKLWNEGMTSEDVCSHYGSSKSAFVEQTFSLRSFAVHPFTTSLSESEIYHRLSISPYFTPSNFTS